MRYNNYLKWDLWRRRDLLLLLYAATRWQSRHFGFTFGGQTNRSSLLMVYGFTVVNGSSLTCCWSWCSSWGPCSPVGRVLGHRPGSWWALSPLGCIHRAGQSPATFGCPSSCWSPDTCPCQRRAEKNNQKNQKMSLCLRIYGIYLVDVVLSSTCRVRCWPWRSSAVWHSPFWQDGGSLLQVGEEA